LNASISLRPCPEPTVRTRPRTCTVSTGCNAETAEHQSPLRILVFLEGMNVTGAVKPVLEFVREAAETSPRFPLELAMVLFVRRDVEDLLYRTVRTRGIPVEIVRERRPFDLQVIPQLRNIVRQRRPDLIWTNNTKSHFLVRLIGLNRIAKWVAVHQGYTKEAWRTRFYNQFDRWSHRGADRVITVCDDFADGLLRRGVPKQRILVLHNPIRPLPGISQAEKDRLRESYGLSRDTMVILSVGRLSLEKGHADLLRAMTLVSRAQNTRLVIVGDGPERKRLETLRSRLQLDDVVRFVGYQEDVHPLFAIADLFVLPSHSEGSPNALLEALDAGVPTIAAAVGGVPEIVSDGVSALLVPRHDIPKLAVAIRRLLSDPLLRAHLAENGRKVVRRHDPQSYFRIMTHIFEDVLGTSHLLHGCN
jgi:glycosyltransferase involved in cell wall biosynthesis